MSANKKSENRIPVNLRRELEALADERPSLRPSLDFAEQGDELAAVETTLRNQNRALYKLLGARRAVADFSSTAPSLARVHQLAEEAARLEKIAAEKFPLI